jgi:hypothetical protein
MFDPAIASKLRGCNVVKVKIGDLVSGGGDRRPAEAGSLTPIISALGNMPDLLMSG